MPDSERHGLTTERQEMTPAPIRIDLGRGVRALLWSLVLPVSFALLVDWLVGSLPWVTIAAALICIPLATVVVSRIVLAEFDRVVALVAPPEAAVEEDDSGEPAAESSTAADAGDAADSLPTDWPLAGQPFTEGAHRHHG